MLPFRRARAPRAARGERVYAIGDVHGCYDLLCELLERVDEHESGLPSSRRVRLIVLGDFIDRGSDSARVVRFLQNLTRATDNTTVLLGNHEELLLAALSSAAQAQTSWLRCGGGATLRSFGLDPAAIEHIDDAHAIAVLMRSAISAEVTGWLRSLPLTARSGDYFFCHAGVRPGVPLTRQKRADLLWIREEFLESDAEFGGIVVHGHSVSSEVDLAHNRIGIDTGAYRTGNLTALYLEGDQREIISTSAFQ